jgi:GTPase SAR1 family protein
VRDFTFKVLLLGDSAVGKTSILRKATDGKLAPLATVTTMGVDLGVKKVATADGRAVTLQCWDTAGQVGARGCVGEGGGGCYANCWVQRGAVGTRRRAEWRARMGTHACVWGRR